MRTVLAPCACLSIAAASACVSSRAVLVGAPRPPIPPAQVRIYLEPPASNYAQIAILNASSRGSFALTAVGKMDKVIERLKQQASRLGANGILLHGVGNQGVASVGAGISTEMNSTHSPYGLGFGASAFFTQMAGEGVAIYVDPR